MSAPLHRHLGSPVYWGCQALGWGGISVLGILDEIVWVGWRPGLPVRFLWTGAAGCAVCHLYRAGVLAAGWTGLPARQMLPRAVVGGVLLMAALFGAAWGLDLVFHSAGAVARQVRSVGWSRVLLLAYAVLLGGMWNAVYFALHAGRALDRERHRAEAGRLRLQIALVEAELRALRAQVHPHFLFNCLNGLRGLVTEEPARARAAITRLAHLLRYSLQSGDAPLVTLERELRFVDDYLALEAIRFEERLRVRRDIAPDARHARVPPLAVQTLVENALKYGVAPFDQPPEVTLRAWMDGGDTLCLEVANGGRLVETRAGTADHAPASIGLGLANLRERLGHLFGAGGTLELTQDTPDRVTARLRVVQGPGPGAVLSAAPASASRTTPATHGEFSAR